MQEITCWNCQAPNKPGQIFCGQCKKVQLPAPDIDHFQRLGVMCDFEIGYKNLEVAYFALQRQLHPDAFVGKTEKEKAISMQQSLDLNNAFETLKSPLKRAEYILKLNGVTVNTDDANTKPSQEILMATLESREKLEYVTTPEEIRTLAVESAEARLQTIDAIKNYFEEGNLAQAAQATIKLRYLEKLIEEIRLR